MEFGHIQAYQYEPEQSTTDTENEDERENSMPDGEDQWLVINDS